MELNIPVYDIQAFEEYKNQGIFVGRFGRYAKTHQNLHLAHGHSFYHLVYFTSAQGKQRIDFESMDVNDGQIYFMIPGQVHSWHFTGEPDGYIVNFSPAFFKSFLLDTAYLHHFPFFKGILAQQAIDIPLSQRERIVFIFEELLQRSNTAPRSTQDDLDKVLLLELFILVNRLVPEWENEGEASSYSTLINSFQKLIDLHFIEKRLPKDYAELLFITPNHLNAVCMKMTGKSAGKMIRERVILEAKRLLVNLNLNISQIAEKLKFNDLSYFTKFFKKYEAVTPEKFRKQHTL